jgi:lipid-binding SYLF domain-containing protein
MNPIRRASIAAAVLLPLLTGTALAQQDVKPNTMPAPKKVVPKAEQQAEIRSKTTAALEKFYTTEPRIKTEVAAAPGYAVFTTYGLSFMFGGAGGKGLVHDNATKKEIFMDLAQASAGVQIGASESDMLVIFANKKAMTDFVEKGWTAGAGGGGTMGAAGKTAGGTTGQKVGSESMVYTITKTGLQAGGAVEGTKVWKDKKLN